MTRPENDEDRDERIKTEIIVDTYSPEEQAMGWYAYMDDVLDVPFEARCHTEREESPLEEGERVRVVGMAPTEPTLNQLFVTIEWMDRELGATQATGTCRRQQSHGTSDRRLALLAQPLTAMSVLRWNHAVTADVQVSTIRENSYTLLAGAVV